MRRLSFEVAFNKCNLSDPVIIRVLLFWFAYYDMYMPKWSFFNSIDL